MENCLFKQSGQASWLHVDCLESVHHIWRHWATQHTFVYMWWLTGADCLQMWGYPPLISTQNWLQQQHMMNQRQHHHHMEIFDSVTSLVRTWSSSLDRKLISQLVTCVPHNIVWHKQFLNLQPDPGSERCCLNDETMTVTILSQNSTSTNSIVSKKLLKPENNLLNRPITSVRLIIRYHKGMW